MSKGEAWLEDEDTPQPGFMTWVTRAAGGAGSVSATCEWSCSCAFSSKAVSVSQRSKSALAPRRLAQFTFLPLDGLIAAMTIRAMRTTAKMGATQCPGRPGAEVVTSNASSR
jgi:hypothetical protein